jgi:hypothetical protein
VKAVILTLALLHEESVSSSRLEFADREIRATFTFSLEDLAGLARLDLNRNGSVEPEEWARVLPSIFAYIGERFRIEAGGEWCRSEGDLSLLPKTLSLADGRAPVRLTLRYYSSRPFGSVKVCCLLFREHAGNPRHVAELPGRTVVFDRDRTQTGFSAARAGLRIPWGAAAAAAALILALGAGLLRRASAAAGP